MRPDRISRRGRTLAGLLLFAAVAVSSVYFSSGAVIEAVRDTSGRLDVDSRLESGFANIASSAASGIYSLPKIYHLPVDDSPAMPAREECYTRVTGEDGITYDVYEDDTITVKAWHTRTKGVTVNLAEIEIDSATQIRSGFAGGTYSATVRDTPLNIAKACNAVVAVNADFANYRTSGLVLRQGRTYRTADSSWDVLLIDSKGDLHTCTCREALKGNMLEELDIVNAFTFGPATIKDGEIRITNGQPLPARGSLEPRTSIGQLGERHYLLATCDGRAENSPGLTVYGMAEVMKSYGCTIAYNLDGGHSTTMVFHNKVYNKVAYGGQRTMSDILYFGSALPKE